MLIDKVVEQTKKKKNPCIVGLDPEWSKIPDCYKQASLLQPEAVLNWALDVIDCVSDIVPAIKPQVAFYEVYGAEGVGVFQKIVAYAHEKGLIVVDDSKRNDIGNTARAYAFAHLSKEGPINADFLTVSPFLGRDSICPFIDIAVQNEKGIFLLVKTSNPDSVEISNARNESGVKISDWLAEYVCEMSDTYIGECGYSAIGAVVGATFPKEAVRLRNIMKNNYFLVPGFGAQGGSAGDIVSCFHEDGLGALVSSSRGVLYHYLETDDYDNSKKMYLEIVRNQATSMQQEVYTALKGAYKDMAY